MTKQQALMLVAGIAVGIVVTAQLKSMNAQAQAETGGAFQFHDTPNGMGYLLNTRTGELRFCYENRQCSKATQY